MMMMMDDDDDDYLTGGGRPPFEPIIDIPLPSSCRIFELLGFVVTNNPARDIPANKIVKSVQEKIRDDMIDVKILVLE